MAIGLIAGAASSVIGGLFQGFGARRAARKARARARKLQANLNRLERNRQDIINPADQMQDRSDMIQNQFGNLQVATQAAEFQAEEADVSLANTLDTLRATGAGAGGATALAQAALRSKRGVSATIEQQEAQNQRLAAQGAQQAQTARLAEGSRLDQGRMAGAQFEFNVRENREQMKIDRTAGLLDQQRARAASLKAQASQGFGQALGAIGGLAAGGLAGGGSFKENFNTNFGLGG